MIGNTICFKKVRILLLAAMIFLPCAVEADFSGYTQVKPEFMYRFFEIGESLNQCTMKETTLQPNKFVRVDGIAINQSGVSNSHLFAIPPGDVTSKAGEQECSCDSRCKVGTHKCKKSFHDGLFIGFGYVGLILTVMICTGRMHY